jgi:peptidoglycan hydrolase-like protein with peptidoglycan-binding domain
VAQTQGQSTPQDRTSAPQSTASQPGQNQKAASASPPGQSEKATGSAAGPLLNLTPDQVRQAQTLLKQKGFDPGDIDGVLGPRRGAGRRVAAWRAAARRAAAWLQGASLADARLQGASLVGAGLQGASLREARLQGASPFDPGQSDNP